MPNCQVFRPADGNETSAAYLSALQSHCPSILALSRQNLPQLEGSTVERAVKGGYVLQETTPGKTSDIIFVSTGSEVSICLEAVKILEKEGVSCRLVSMPCCELFDMQSREYQLSVLPDGTPILSVEALAVFGWSKYSHEQMGLDTFGASGKFEQVYAKFGLTGPNIAEKAKNIIQFYSKSGRTLHSPINTALAHRI